MKGGSVVADPHAMRVFLALCLLFVAVVGCSVGTECNCPDTSVTVLVALPCGTTTQPTMTLSGVCANTGTQVNGSPAFSAGSAGTCHVVLTGSTTFSTDVEFVGGAWLACGSNAHGCGQLISPNGLPGGPGIFTLSVGAQCIGDGGADGADE